jgi:DNA-binding MarR family transcriptional regulator
LHLFRCIVFDMDALDLIVLGRQLARIGETVLRGGPSPAMPTSAGLVLADVLAHPGTSVGEITSRTSMPQSQVSQTVAQLRSQGIVESFPDPGDRRRTLLRVSDQHARSVRRAGGVSADAALAGALGDSSAEEAADLIVVLEDLAEWLRPAPPGPVLRQLSRAGEAREPA